MHNSFTFSKHLFPLSILGSGGVIGKALFGGYSFNARGSEDIMYKLVG